jgi:hypothetical protein
MDILRNHHYLFTIIRVGSEGHTTRWEAQQFPGSNIEYTIIVDNNSQSITSNGQMAVVTNVDTVWIPGDVDNLAVTKFRCFDPPGVTLGPDAVVTDTIFVEDGLIQPNTAKLIIKSPSVTGRTAPRWNRMIKETYQDLIITTEGNLTEAVIFFKYTNITHRLPVEGAPAVAVPAAP